MSNTLMIHLGTPKTGTSALQKFLADNAEQLKEYGWCYPNMEKEWAALKGDKREDFAKNGALVKFSMVKKWPKRKKDTLWNIILKYLKEYNVILSDEGLWSYPGLSFADVIKEIKSRYDNVKVICYLRRQDLYIESKWNQDVKSGFFSKDVAAYYELKKDGFDYKERMEMMSEIFGKENVICRVYEKDQFSGTRKDITSDFLEACGIGSDWEKVILPGHVNERIDNDVLGLKHMFNQKYEAATEKLGIKAKGQRLIRKYFMELSLGGESAKVGYLSKEQREDFLKKYADGNEYVAREYLGRNDGKLFYDTNIDIPLYIPSFTDREEKIVELFAGIIAEQEKIREEIEKEKELSQERMFFKVLYFIKSTKKKISLKSVFRKNNFK